MKASRLVSTSTRDWWHSFDPRSTFELVIAGQRSIFGKIDVFFSTLQDNSDAGMADIAMTPLPSCLLDHLQHFGIELIAFVRFLLLHNPRKTSRSRPLRSFDGGRPAASDFGSSLLLAPCRKSEVTVSRMNNRYNFRTSKNPYRQHMNLS